jgi:molecular chaperone GrpE
VKDEMASGIHESPLAAEAGDTASPSGNAAFHAATLLQLLRRERSDFLNYKRRTEHERSAAREQVRIDSLNELLPALDDLDRAFEQLPATLANDSWVRGVALAHGRIEEVLQRWGVERFGRVGERFDPGLHEAVAYLERGNRSEMQIEVVERIGYRLGPRLIRPARVTVSGPRRDTPPRATGEQEEQQ